jgi:radical SAM family uncharacterized protein/radical SAM-linked protein
MRTRNIPLYSLETYRPLRQFDVIGFTLSYEMVYTNLLNMLDLAGISLLTSKRSDEEPLVAAGGPICFNPEPMADFIDFFFIGEVEEAIPELIEALKEGRGKSRRERLLRLAQVESVYVPGFYDPETKKPVIDGVPEKIIARHTLKLQPEYYPSRPIVPLTEITHDRVTVEIMRGCPRSCRFCQASRIYRPVRLRSIDDIKKQVMANLKATGHDEVGLLSLSTSDYPDIDRLTSTLVMALEPKRIALSLPSLRPAGFSVTLADAARKSHKTGLTFAPEVGTDRMRRVVGKKITEEELLNAVRLAFEKGWQLVKLYFMIGLPTETEDDVRGIIDLIAKTVRVGRQIKGRHKINITISPFSPKAHTPFQWDRLCRPEEIRRKNNYLKENIRAREVTLKFRDPNRSYMEGVIGRGDHRTGKVILSAFRGGARFDGWSEHFDIEIWKKAFAENGLEPEEFAREFSFSEPLPWDHIDSGNSKEQFAKDRSRILEVIDEPSEEPVVSVNAKQSSNSENMFGRRKRKIPVTRSAASPTRGKIRLKWGKSGPVRFMSHLDNNRVFGRAIRRADLPVVYSLGFHPHQKLSFGPPLPVGYSSESEFLDIQIDGICSCEKIDALAQMLPCGFSIYDHKSIFSRAPAISTLLNRAVYIVDGDFGDTDLLYKRIDEILSRDSVIAVRTTREGGKEVEIRPAIYRFDLRCGDAEPVIEMELGLGQGGYAKPNEVLEVLNIFEPEQIVSFHFHRKALHYRDEQGVYLDPLAAVV